MKSKMQASIMRLHEARETTYRAAFKKYVDGLPHTMSDETVALVFASSQMQFVELSDIRAALPEACKEHFKILQSMNTARGAFFARFVLFMKSRDDGLLEGVGADEMYYVLATWDRTGCDMWTPEHDLHNRPVLVLEETKTVICLSHHGKVTVVLKKYGDGHVALCPECKHLAYFD